MEKLEKVELVREKTGVTYQDAKEALEANDYDVLDAITWLESEGKINMTTSTFETDDAQYTLPEAEEPKEAGTGETSKKSRVRTVWARFCSQFKSIIHAGMEKSFVAEKDGEPAISVPLLLVVIGMLLWGATLWLLIIGLFLGFRYHIEGNSTLTVDVNEAMDKVADAAESIKNEFAQSA